MRAMDQIIQDRLRSAFQTKHNNANPSMEVQAIRPRTPIFHDRLWQESVVAADTTAVCTSVAVRRTGATADRVFVAYVTSTGDLVVKSAAILSPVSSMVWTVEETIENCSECALVYDGSFVPDEFGNVEYLTEDTPYLFYTNSANSLWYKKVGGEQNPLLGANVTSVDAVRGVASITKDPDQGMIVFYVIAGVLYYNCLVNGEWEGQTQVPIGPATVVNVKAERTFDWRICLHVTDDTGALYEIFTRMEASGWNSFEFIEMTGMSASANLIPIGYHDTKADEYTTMTAMAAVGVWMANYSPTLLRAWNIEENSGDYGFKVIFEFDQYIPNAPDYPAAFKLGDNIGMSFYGLSAEVNGRFVTVTFSNLNNAENPVTATALAGNLNNGLVDLVESSIQTNLTNLVPYYVDPPALLSAYNDGAQRVVLKFDAPILLISPGIVLTVSADEPEFSPEGDLINTEYVIDSIGIVDGDNTKVEILLTAAGRMKYPQGNIAVDYITGIIGDGSAAVQEFTEAFAPTGLTPFFNPHAPEHTELASIAAGADLIEVTYHDRRADHEYTTLVNMLATAELIHIDDLEQ